MAEGFARTYGADVIEPVSAGLSPAPIVQPLTKEVMQAKNINIDDQYPKDLGSIDALSFDLIVNMSGSRLPPRIPIEVRDWDIEDPILRSKDVYIAVRDQIENLVMNLILELRRANGGADAQEIDPSKRKTRPRPLSGSGTALNSRR
jgi:protein-tyrosine-phosphatase